MADDQLNIAKQKHREHFKLGLADYIDISTNTIEEWEYQALHNKMPVMTESEGLIFDPAYPFKKLLPLQR